MHQSNNIRFLDNRLGLLLHGLIFNDERKYGQIDWNHIKNGGIFTFCQQDIGYSDMELEETILDRIQPLEVHHEFDVIYTRYWEHRELDRYPSHNIDGVIFTQNITRR